VKLIWVTSKKKQLRSTPETIHFSFFACLLKVLGGKFLSTKSISNVADDDDDDDAEAREKFEALHSTIQLHNGIAIKFQFHCLMNDEKLVQINCYVYLVLFCSSTRLLYAFNEPLDATPSS
jgi:hypothetical protein